MTSTGPRAAHDQPGGARRDAARPGGAKPGSTKPGGAQPGDAKPGGARFRPELHGLRGVAILLVVLYHVWLGRVSGGVDVFLFLSAFLFTGTFVRRAHRGEPLRPVAYWARTFKRLLPPTVVIALATLAGVRLLLPPERLMPAITDALGSILQVENWVLIRRGVDYYAAAEAGPTPFQHFWSLSIQGQIFVLFPLLIALCAVLARWLRVRIEVVLTPVLVVVLGASFAWSVISTASQQETAYFDTSARVWEFAAGALLALALPVLEARRDAPTGGAERRRGRRAARPVNSRGGSRGTAVRVAAGWLGLIGLISCGLIVNVRGAFPGWIAAWPLAAAALVLAAGATGVRFSADRLLSSRPAALLGDISYGLYLVHWPLLTLYLQHAGKQRADALEGAVLIAASLVLAWLLTRLVDTPIRRWRWANAKALRAGGVVAVVLVLGLAPVLALRQHLLDAEQDARARAVADNPGARVLEADYTPHPDADPHAGLLPHPELIGKDWVGVPDPCEGKLAPQGAEREQLTKLCRTVPAEREDAPVLVIVGNSRMEQLAGALLPLAQREGWQVVTIWKGGCVYAPDGRMNPDCDAYSRAAAAYIDRVHPDAVATETTFVNDKGEESTTRGMKRTIPALQKQGIRLIALRDTARLRTDPPGCLNAHDQDEAACTEPLAAPLRKERPDAALLTGTGVHAVDANPMICPDGSCPPVIGNVLVWIDRNHISRTYAESMQDGVDRILTDSGWRW